MTLTEFRNEFNILYDSIASNSAPDLDDYEISVLLTQAQEQIVKNKFEEISNRQRKGFEATSKRRNDLKELIRSHTSTVEEDLVKNIKEGTQFFIIPSDVFLIIQESAIVTCNNVDHVAKVIPKTHDEYNYQIENPFKQPYLKEVWRMDYSSKESGNKVVELISGDSPVKSYSVRYIKYPSPIILSDLTVLENGLSVNNQTGPLNTELDDGVSREVLDRAVEMAILAYRENNLTNNTQLNNRNE